MNALRLVGCLALASVLNVPLFVGLWFLLPGHWIVALILAAGTIQIPEALLWRRPRVRSRTASVLDWREPRRLHS